MLYESPLHIITEDNKSRARHVYKKLSQGSVFAPRVFNLFTSDMPRTKSTKFVYADDLALATRCRTMNETNDM